MKSHVLFAILAVSVCLVTQNSALSFDALPNQIKCFRESLSRGQVISGETGSQISPLMQLKFWIENPYKRTVFNTEDTTAVAKFSFVADVDGEYKFCFVDNRRINSIMGTPSARKVFFNYKIDEDKTKDYKVPTKTGLKPLEAELQRIEQVAIHVSAESDHQREREATHRDTSETLNSRVAWYSMLSLFCLVALSGAQVFYIQRYLKKTKWID